ELGGLEDVGHPRHVPFTRSPGPEGADETASEVESPRHRTMKSNSPSMNGENRRPKRFVDKPTRSSTRIPYGRNRYQPGSQVRGKTRSMSDEPSSGGIGSRLNRPRRRFASAKKSSTWITSGKSAVRNALPV